MLSQFLFSSLIILYFPQLFCYGYMRYVAYAHVSDQRQSLTWLVARLHRHIGILPRAQQVSPIDVRNGSVVNG